MTDPRLDGNDNRLVSVIIPVFNGERYLRAAVESCIAQTYRPVEVIVVDDGSTDGTSDVAAGLIAEAGDDVRIRYETQSNAGAATARNYGVEIAAGSYLAFLDSDDLWTPDKLQRQMTALEDAPQCDAVFGHMEQFISPELDDKTKTSLRCPAHAMPGYTHCTMLIRRDSFTRVGKFDTEWQIGEFVAWYLKALEHDLSSMMLPDVVLRRRLHDGNQGVSKRDYQTDYVRILKASLDRRRGKTARA